MSKPPKSILRHFLYYSCYPNTFYIIYNLIISSLPDIQRNILISVTFTILSCWFLSVQHYVSYNIVGLTTINKTFPSTWTVLFCYIIFLKPSSISTTHLNLMVYIPLYLSIIFYYGPKIYKLCDLWDDMVSNFHL